MNLEYRIKEVGEIFVGAEIVFLTSTCTRGGEGLNFLYEIRLNVWVGEKRFLS